MNLNRIELKKIQYSFNSISNRLMQADYEDYNTALFKFVDFLEKTDLIYEYIKSCGEYEGNIEGEVTKVAESYGRDRFDLGWSDEEEVRAVFALLKYIVEKDISVVAFRYSSSNRIQEQIKGFNERVVMILIRHIERELTKVGIEMGIDERVTYSIAVENGQVNIAQDHSVIHAENMIGGSHINSLIESVKTAASELTEEEKEDVFASLEIIKKKANSEKPDKGFLRMAMHTLKHIKGAGEFTEAVSSLIEFLEPLIRK